MYAVWAKAHPSAATQPIENIGVPYGIRTRVIAVRGRRPRPLDERDLLAFATRPAIVGQGTSGPSAVDDCKANGSGTIPSVYVDLPC